MRKKRNNFMRPLRRAMNKFTLLGIGLVGVTGAVVIKLIPQADATTSEIAKTLTSAVKTFAQGATENLGTSTNVQEKTK